MNRYRLWTILAAVIIILGVLTAAVATHLSEWRFVSCTAPADQGPDWDLGPEGSPALLLLAPGMGQLVTDGAELPKLSESGYHWSASLVNVRSGGGSSPESIMASLSATTPARGVDGLVLAAKDDLPWGSGSPSTRIVFEDWYGIEIPPAGAAVVDFGRLVDQQETLSWEAPVGGLSAHYRRAGMATAYLSASAFDNSGALAAADKRGVIDYYFDRQTCTVPASLPGGRKTDWEQVVEILTNFPPDVGLAVLQIGDFQAATEHGDWLPDSYRTRKAGSLTASLAELADFLLLQGWGPLLVVDPIPHPQSGMGFVLIASESGQLAVSAATRRPGIVTLGDLGNTLLQGSRSGPSGQTIGFSSALPAASLSDTLSTLNRAIAQARSLRYPLAQGLGIYVIICVLCMAMTLYWWPRWYPLAAANMAAAALLPAAALLAPGLSRPALHSDVPTWAGLLLAWGALLAVSGGAYLLAGRRGALLTAAWITAVAIAADQLTGARLALLSPMGYCPAAGARYYGLGNEFLGVFLGSVLLIVLWGGPSRKLKMQPHCGSMLPWQWVVLLSAGAVICGPQWGNNFGGGLVVACWLTAAAGCTLRTETDSKLGSLLVAAGIVAGALATAAAMLMWHSVASAPAVSHIGQTSQSLYAGDFSAVLRIALRKVETGVRVFRSTIWTRIWLFALGISALVSYRPPAAVSRLFARRPRLGLLSRTAATVSVGALFLNDSGVVTAALLMMGPVAAVMLAVGEELSVGEEN